MLQSRSLLLLVALLFVFPPHARAAGEETAAYTESVQLGLAEFDEKNFLEARVHFERAHGIYPSARTLRALGMVHFELKEYVESARYLTEALASKERPLETDKREATRKLLDRARGYVARFKLDLEPGTRLSVDGKASDVEAGDELVLAVGEHTLEFSAPGRISDRRTLKVRGGERDPLRVRLAEVGAAPVAADHVDTSERRPIYKSPWLWTVLGVALAGAAAGTAIYLTREVKTEAREPYPGSIGQTPLVWN